LTSVMGTWVTINAQWEARDESGDNTELRGEWGAAKGEYDSLMAKWS
jgi:hypothetical protein